MYVFAAQIRQKRKIGKCRFTENWSGTKSHKSSSEPSIDDSCGAIQDYRGKKENRASIQTIFLLHQFELV